MEGTFDKFTLGRAGTLLILTGLLLPSVNFFSFLFYSPSPHLGTLTQFILVLYGTGAASSSSPDEPQPTSSSCKTLDLRQICIGKNDVAGLQLGPHRKFLSQQLRTGSIMKAACGDVMSEVAWIL